MKKIIVASAFILSALNAIAQITNVEKKFDLPTILSESSGAIFFNDRLISHNDSGNENKLYELDTISGLVTRTVTVTNATNIDWEDIAQDDSSIYIGDIGNNSGNRTDLKIYKINKNDYLNSTNITSEIINFSYADQVDFTANLNNTEWDAEALISFDANNLILFTKNWVDEISKAYSIPKNSGTYTVDSSPTPLAEAGLITGATYNPSTEKVYLVGYSRILQPFVWVSENFTNNDIFSGTNTKTSLTSLGFEQTEAITHIGANRYFITSETFNIQGFSNPGKLISFTTNDILLSIIDQDISVVNLYPNPVKDELFIEGLEFTSVEIYDAKSTLVYRGDNQKLNLSKLNKGFYLVKINLKDHTSIVKKIIKE
ncbi:secreted protein with Por secretion system C-terminal sorting domain [Psychroflexus torquis ATCC 700755]|uniref:Secreted protein with Por secretion system C-terminal sorting domain n=1 Tax=Psychroflexus torquis (strain ATCC 700755 / CIP 106069 / ACAM 623) TaxID=313595 RepID=K4IJ30_PSYTT|nr:T9SS type A sorting domain-containing protein [Psychroflexus torquis]AFU70547.1 secreted protein with Por secretion system C-terminal sorting domain [Psychroflexus torquis ATCC 700755]